jgi:hypothetical protein
MPWEKSSADLVALFQQIAPSAPNIEQKKMFGYLCAFVDGYLFTGLFQQSMVFRLAPADRAALLDRPDTEDFEPMPGHKMTGYVLVSDPFAVSEEELAAWAKCALEFASHLPPKATRKATKKATAGKKTR